MPKARTRPGSRAAPRVAAAGVPLPPPATARAITGALLAWYARHRRDLPWRRTRDPYAIWVSEVMLQQTQVATVHDYYLRWMERFPTVRALAAADEAEVLHAWQGLGYYSRARGLHRGARAVAAERGGRLPDTAEELRKLPGIGPYSAGAIASIAFGRPEPVVDGNVARVLCRLFGLRGDPARAPLKQGLWDVARRLVPERSASDFNQALMELGATVCTPRSAGCARCPLASRCVARREGRVEALPETAKRRATVAVHRAAALVSRGGRLLVVQAPGDAPRWASLWLLPSADVRPGEPPEQAARRAVREATGLDAAPAALCTTVRHAVTHHRITLDVYRCRAAAGRPRPLTCQRLRWASSEALDQLPMPSPYRRVLRQLSEAG